MDLAREAQVEVVRAGQALGEMDRDPMEWLFCQRFVGQDERRAAPLAPDHRERAGNQVRQGGRPRLLAEGVGGPGLPAAEHPFGQREDLDQVHVVGLVDPLGLPARVLQRGEDRLVAQTLHHPQREGIQGASHLVQGP